MDFTASYYSGGVSLKYEQKKHYPSHKHARQMHNTHNSANVRTALNKLNIFY